MYDIDTRRQALALLDEGLSLASVSRATGISGPTIRKWMARIEPRARRIPCPR
ncbi:helix-turn-helix domain-containing protein, partial [Streptomyces roseifaciens]